MPYLNILGKQKRPRLVPAFLASILAFAAFAPAAAEGGVSRAPAVNARSAVIIDSTTGTLLYAKNPDLSLPPASLTKLVTLHIVYEEIQAGRLKPEELVTIDKDDCSPRIPYGSSLMYLRPGMKVSVRDLMLGAAVVSGNDAAYALARRISGSNDAFTVRMNQEVKVMGFDAMTFVEPSGISELNFVTARQFVLFCKKYLELHPQSLAELHSVKSIDFPRAEHEAPGFVPEGRIVQYNRNPLIFRYPGADGLKTGYIIEVGYNMAGTAKRVDSRFIVVTLGGSSSKVASGTTLRTKDVTNLLDWGFENFVTASLDPGPLPSPRAWFGASRRLTLVPALPNAVTVAKARAGELKIEVKVPSFVKAPVAKGAVVGKLNYLLDGKELRSIDLVAAQALPKGTIFRRIWDGIGYFLAGIFGKR
ncbi:MAG: D-alanyl-D-alanine carboxypeptidase [Spirochaetes bacterium]|nr:D-alanyl-D-alanine carboxypeptidase [Spirochaetota bacterium]